MRAKIFPATDGRDMPRGYRKTGGCLSSLRSSHGKDAKSELGHDETMVCPAFGTTHGLCHSHVLPVPLSGDDIVNHMPVPRAWVHPRCLVMGGKAE